MSLPQHVYEAYISLYLPNWNINGVPMVTVWIRWGWNILLNIAGVDGVSKCCSQDILMSCILKRLRNVSIECLFYSEIKEHQVAYKSCQKPLWICVMISLKWQDIGLVLLFIARYEITARHWCGFVYIYLDFAISTSFKSTLARSDLI